MNGAPLALQHTGAVFARILIWAWLIGLSVLVGLGYRAMGDLAEREQMNTGLRQVQVIEGRLAELFEGMDTLQARPAPASAANLQELRQSLAARIAQLEEMQGNHASAQALQLLRDEVEQYKSRQAATRPSTPAPRRVARANAADVKAAPFPFRVVGMELRAGLRTVSLAPTSGELSSAQIRVVLPGESVDQWRLEAIDDHTAVFRAGEEVRRLAIP